MTTWTHINWPKVANKNRGTAPKNTVFSCRLTSSLLTDIIPIIPFAFVLTANTRC